MNRAIALLSLLLLAALGPMRAPLAAPGDTLFYDNLNGNLNDWNIVASGGNANIDNKAAVQGRSLELRWGDVRANTDPINAAVPGAELSLWIRRGADNFSENPETGEDLVIEYRDAGNNWVEIDRYDGGGTPGQIYTPNYALPAAALHANLSIRLRLTDGNGSDFDYWHIDDVRVTETGSTAGPPFAPGSCEDFESGGPGWTFSNPSRAGISTATYSSFNHSLYTRIRPVTVTSPTVDLSGYGAIELTMWIRRGGEPFSKKPEDDEDMLISYRRSDGNWSTLELFDGAGTEGQIYTRSYALPADANHAGFEIRLQHQGNGEGYWHFDDICLNPTETVLFSLDEASWTGAPGEVVDSGSLGLSGSVQGGASNDSTFPALASNPGTCRYGVFDGINDYIEIADNPALDITSELTVGAWIYARSLPGELHTIVSKDWNYEFHINSSGQIYWWWNDSSGTTRSITTPGSIGLNQWHHIAIVYASGSQTIYVDGSAWATAAFTGSLRLNDLPLFIGTDYNFISRAFDGYLDEVTIDSRAYSQAEVQALRDATHDCGTASAQFVINHDGFGINCLAESITVDVIDSIAGTPLLSYSAPVVLDTQTNAGSWSLVNGNGVLVDIVPGDGRAVYIWALNEAEAEFALSYPEGDPLISNLEVFQQSDTGIRDNNADGSLVFSPNGFTLTATPLGNPPPGVIPLFNQARTAGESFALNIAAFGQTPNDPVCGIIESYDGARNLQFWSSYLNPASGTRAVEIDAGLGGVPIAGSEAGAALQTVSFVAGQAQVLVKYKDVGSIRIGVKDATTINAELPAGIRGATAGFVLRPADFVLSEIYDADGGLANPDPADASGPRFVAAGAPFRATVTALDLDGDPTPNFGLENIPETVGFETILIAPDPLTGANPPVSAATGFAAFSGGAATGTDFVWPEVGIIRLRPQVGDSDYLGAGNVTGTESANIGRFVPSHFTVAQNVPMFTTQCTAGTFTYAGQAFDYAIVPTITATARAVGGTTTLNYAGDFFRMTTDTLTGRSYSWASGDLDIAGLPSATVDPVVTESGPGVATLVFSAGSGLAFTRDTIAAPLLADIRLEINVLDADSVAAAGNPVSFGDSGGIEFSAGREIRFGRLRFVNAVGSELVNLPVPLITEFYAGPALGFVPNLADSCTTGISISLGPYTENLGSADTCVLDSGAPGASGAGCAVPAPLLRQFHSQALGGDFNLTLAAPGADEHGSVQVEATAPDWLLFDWDAALPGNENPTGIATFGLYGGEPAQIYLRELYN